MRLTPPKMIRPRMMASTAAVVFGVYAQCGLHAGGDGVGLHARQQHATGEYGHRQDQAYHFMPRPFSM